MRRSTVAVAVAVGLTACGAARETGFREGVDTVPAADRALAQARSATLGARYWAVRWSDGRELVFSRRVTVIKRRGRVLAWEDRRQSFTRSKGVRCFARSTDFNRADARGVRQGAAPPHAGGARLIERDGRPVLLVRQPHLDFADTEFEIRLAPSGRPLAMRMRAARFGVLPPGRWHALRYEFLSAAEFQRRAGGPPGPRCP